MGDRRLLVEFVLNNISNCKLEHKKQILNHLITNGCKKHLHGNNRGVAINMKFLNDNLLLTIYVIIKNAIEETQIKF